MVVVNLDIPENIYSNFSDKKVLKYDEIINYYEESCFEYEKVGMKAGDFKNYLIKELGNG